MYDNIIIRKNLDVYEKKSDDFFVLLNIKERSMFSYKKDVKIVWDLITEEISMDVLFNNLIEKGYSLKRIMLNNTIETLLKSGLLLSDSIKEDDDFIKKNNCISQYIEYCDSKEIISNIMLEITNNCNLSCKHCYHDEKIETLSLEELESLFDSLKNSSIIMVVLTGGEIIKHPKWKSILQAAKKNGLLVSIISNFTLMDDSDSDYIIDTGIYSIKTSLYGNTEVTHDSITKVEGSFNKTINRIKYFTDRGMHVNINYMIMKDTYKEASEAKKLAKMIGANIAYDFRIHPSRSGKGNIENLYIDDKDFDILYREGILSKSVQSACVACINRVRINQNGDVFPCELLKTSLGNIRTENFNDIIHNEKVQKVKEKIYQFIPDKCEGCDYCNVCTKCSALIWNEDSFDYNCYYTKISL